MFDDIFSSLDTIHERDRQTDGHRSGDSKDRAYVNGEENQRAKQVHLETNKKL